MNRAVIRWGWLAWLVIQIILYVFCYPALLRVEARHPALAGMEGFNAIVLDVMGAFFWCLVLLFFENVQSLPRWLQVMMTIICFLFVVGVVRLNVNALIGA